MHKSETNSQSAKFWKRSEEAYMTYAVCKDTLAGLER